MQIITVKAIISYDEKYYFNLSATYLFIQDIFNKRPMANLDPLGQLTNSKKKN